MTDEIPAYRFRWDNVDIKSYVDGRKAKAQILRREAQMLICKAETIEEEAYALGADLIKIEPEGSDE